MSTAIAPLFSLNHSRTHSARYFQAVDELNHCANDLNRGGSVEDIKKTAEKIIIKKAATANHAPWDKISPAIHWYSDDDSDDLVALLIQDNQDIWNELLQNKFVTAMATADAGNVQVTNGFKWYMIQDFFYCLNIVIYYTERGNKARVAAELTESTRKISSNATYTNSIFDTCTNVEKLGINDEVVLSSLREPALLAYVNGAIDVGADTRLNWVSTQVFMIPCIQSYYKIAVNLSETPGISTESLWYKFWIEDNLQYEDSIKKQIAFFKATKNDWIDAYNSGLLSAIFRQACEYEIGLWSVGENPGISS